MAREARNGVAVKPIGPLAPNLSAYAERWVQSVEQECLDRFVVFGVDHLRHLVSEYVAHYHAERPHQGLGNLPPAGPPPGPVGPPASAAVVCEERLGGLLRHYRRAA